MTNSTTEIPAIISNPTTTTTTTDNPPPLISFNVGSQFTVRLNGNNYSSWKSQFTSLLYGYHLMSHIDGTGVAPTDTTSAAYLRWARQDHFIFHAILASVGETIMPHIDAATTARAAWVVLERMYASKSQSRIMGLKDRLSTFSRGSLSLPAYLSQIKLLAGELALAGAPVDDMDLVLRTLNGIGSDFKEIAAAVRARDTPPSFDELYEKLLGYDDFLQRSVHLPQSPLAHAAARQPRPHQGSRSSPRGPGPRRFSPGPGPLLPSPGPRPVSSVVVCQYCQKTGHTARRCFSLFPELRSTTPQAHLTVGTSSVGSTPSWLLDSGASHHVTADLANLDLSEKYEGPDTIAIGDGTAHGTASSSGPRA